MKKLSTKVHLTGHVSSSRVLKLEEEEIIVGYTLTINEERVEYLVHCFITVFTKSLHHKPYYDFISEMEEYIRCVKGYVI